MVFILFLVLLFFIFGFKISPFQFFRSIPYHLKDLFFYVKNKGWRVFREFGLVMYLGSFGRGKTLQAVNYVVSLHKRFPDIPIYSNITLKGIDYIPLTSFQQVVEIDTHAIVLIDEMGVMFNNRAFGSFPMALLDNILQCRHLGLLIVGTAQKYEDLDLIIRKNITEVREVKKLTSRLISYDVYDGYDCYYSQVDYHNTRPRFKNWFSVVTDAMRSCYDTHEIATNIKSGDVVEDSVKTRTIQHSNNLVLRNKRKYNGNKWGGSSGK